MRVHHLNCGTMCPISARLTNGAGGLLARGRMVCHCLLIEAPDGLVLVDTGLGTEDVADGPGRLGRGFVSVLAPPLLYEETALAQIKRLGFTREDVRHIVPTHLDLDHAGGLPDFPAATVHIFADEHDAAMQRATLIERERYKSVQWVHGPAWQRHSLAGDTWLGLECVRCIGPDVALVPVVGHTRGHCAVAVRSDNGWLVHAGDAYFNHSELDPVHPRCPPALAAFQWIVAMDNQARLRNRERLFAVAREHAAQVKLFCAHDPQEFAQLAGA